MSAVDWFVKDWGGRVHYGTTDDLGDHGHGCDETGDNQ